MLTAATLITRASEKAKASGYTVQALDLLNSILSDLAEGYDLAIARDLFSFNFNPNLTSNFGSGPYNLPVDYLRASGSSGEGQKAFFWTLNGVPKPMVPVDLSEFDMQVKQAGLQSYPLLWATDLSNSSRATSSRYKTVFGAGLTAGNTVATVAANLNIAVGDGVAGEGIVSGTTVSAYSGSQLTLSTAPTATLSNASLFAGVPPQGYAYPSPSGNYAVTIRYQRMMPPIIDTTKVPWFPNEGYLLDELTGRLMEMTDDPRASEFLGSGQMAGRSGRRLRQFLEQVDDKRNRPQQIELDRRSFGPNVWQRLRSTKQVGWVVLLCVSLSGMLAG